MRSVVHTRGDERASLAQGSGEKLGDVQRITPADLAAAGPNITLIDVREPDEFASGHVPGAVNIPLGDVPARMGEIPAEEPVYLICRSGGRSARAGEYLERNGYDTVNIEGGTLEWAEQGRDLEHPTN